MISSERQASVMNREKDSIDDRNTIRVRHVGEGSIYTLNFEGDIGKITGSQLKTHFFSICGVPVDQQIVTINGKVFHDECTGYDMGLRSGSMVTLEQLQHRRAAPLGGGGGGVEQTPAARSAASRNGLNRTLHSTERPSQSMTSAAHRSKFEEELRNVRNTEELVLRRQDALNHHTRGQASSFPIYGASGVYDDVDVDVEIVDETQTAWCPMSSADIEESRLLQQDYVWKMEQVRFETERMNREREMLRQQKELEYQAEVLERERILVERKTQSERLKLALMQNAIQEEMSIFANVTMSTNDSRAPPNLRYD